MPIASARIKEEQNVASVSDNGFIAPQPPCSRCQLRRIECVVDQGLQRCKACAEAHTKCSLFPPTRDTGKGRSKPANEGLSRKSVHRSKSPEKKRVEIHDAQHRARDRLISTAAMASQAPRYNPASTSANPSALDTTTRGKRTDVTDIKPHSDNQVRQPKQYHYGPTPHLVNAIQLMAQSSIMQNIAVLEIAKHYGADSKIVKTLKERIAPNANPVRIDVDE